MLITGEKIMKKLLVLVLVTILTGCANHRAVLTNKEGVSSLCHAEGYGLFPAMWAKEDFDKCVKEANARGYK
jgi:hypothetical protein